MKKILLLITFSVLLTFSCTDLEDLNENVKDPTIVPAETLFTAAQNRLADQMINTNVNNNIFRLIMQYFTEVTYTDESNYDIYKRNIPDNHNLIMCRNVLKDLDEASILLVDEFSPSEEMRANNQAIIEVLAVYTWANLVELFGDIPYTEALNIDILAPAYDDALTIYTDLISRLNAAITTLNANTDAGAFDADNMFFGNVEAWVKFANSLRLRMGLVLADCAPTLSVTTVNAAVAGDLISSNDENALYHYGSSQPNTNPLYDDLVASGRNDFVPSLTIVDPMNTLNDPRRPFFYTMYNGAYVGGENGVENSYGTLSHIADAIKAPDAVGVLFDYAEVEFLLAEAAARGGYNVANPETHYEAAIRASIEYWGGTSLEADAYLAQPAVAYATASGDWKEKIGLQAYIALYNRGFEAWTRWRILDQPTIDAPPDAISPTPVRFTYDIQEQTLNSANWQAASNAIGGDDVDTKLFFDLN